MPTIAEVYTRPADEDGKTVGKLLHAGTGLARRMVVRADSRQEPRALATSSGDPDVGKRIQIA